MSTEITTQILFLWNQRYFHSSGSLQGRPGELGSTGHRWRLSSVSLLKFPQIPGELLLGRHSTTRSISHCPARVVPEGSVLWKSLPCPVPWGPDKRFTAPLLLPLQHLSKPRFSCPLPQCKIRAGDVRQGAMWTLAVWLLRNTGFPPSIHHPD